MGYVSDFSAPRRWICGWIFIDKARKSLKEICETEYKDITINTLAQNFRIFLREEFTQKLDKVEWN